MPRCTPAEAARSMMLGSASLQLCCADGNALPLISGYSADSAGRLLLALPDNLPLIEAVERHGDATVEVEVCDVAPLPLRRRIRGRTTIRGWLEPIDQRLARRLWKQTTCDCEPPPTRLYVLPPAEITLERDERLPVDVDLTDYACARPDPLARVESELLHHLAYGHPEALEALTPQLPCSLLDLDPRIVPWRLNRYELVLRVEGAQQDVDVSFALPKPSATEPGQVIEGLRSLVTSSCSRSGGR
jgi:hypothetical protein